ncbi:MAG: DUF481 domain-containing protein [Candidatus Aminicenantales bacterium]
MSRSHQNSAIRVPAAAAVLLLTLWPGRPAAGDEAQKPFIGWKDTAELSYVVTGGNADTSTFSFGNTFKRSWAEDALTIKAFALSSHATTSTMTAQGTETDYTILEQKTSRLVAENFILSAQYDHRLSKKVVLQFGLGWDRNRFSGLASRGIFTVGTGYAWIETKRTTFKTDGGFSYTFRKYFGQSASSFAGFRAIASFSQKILETSSFGSQFTFDENLEKAVDWRYDWTNSVTASISKSLALKTSLRLLFANLPANEAVPLYNPDGTSTDLTVQVPLKKLDTIFTTSIVINF